MKDFWSARKHFEEALKLDPNGQYAQEAKEALQKLKKTGIWLTPLLQAKDIIVINRRTETSPCAFNFQRKPGINQKSA